MVCLRTASLRFDLVPVLIIKLVRFKRPADLDNPRCNCSAVENKFIREASEAMVAAVRLDDRQGRVVAVGAINSVVK